MYFQINMFFHFGKNMHPKQQYANCTSISLNYIYCQIHELNFPENRNQKMRAHASTSKLGYIFNFRWKQFKEIDSKMVVDVTYIDRDMN